MKKISVLDCTLRDGGYCNQWKFGKHNITRIINGLIEADIDIIECGFLTKKVKYDIDATQFTDPLQVGSFIPANKHGKLFVCMINYGEFPVEELPLAQETALDGIRVAFHKKDMLEAMACCRRIKEKGYKVFVQPMVSLSYTEDEFIQLIHMSNELMPYAFYIVDSFGVMKRKNLLRLYNIVEEFLNESIIVGYHSHNNMQLAYSNAQTLADIETGREMIIDSSIFGMGRGAGNLNTELFVEYLNDNCGKGYIRRPLLIIIDEILNNFHETNYWGYSLPNYLSAKHNAHPNYAGYLDSKKTLTVEAMDEIFAMMDEDMKISYDKDYAEELYVKYMARGNVNEERLAEFKNLLAGKSVLIVAPGSSSVTEKEKILPFSDREDVVVISVNFEYDQCETDFIFMSNLRRFRKLKDGRKKCIVTSNISADGVYLQINYESLLNDYEGVRDNAGMMLIKFLMELGVKKIYLAGLDGYSVDPTQNFADETMRFFTQKNVFEAMNAGMNSFLKEYSKSLEIEFVTTQKYVEVK